MITLHLKTIAPFLAFFYLINTINANVYPIALNQRIDASTQIAMGKIVQQYSFWDKHRTNIYTAHLIEVSAYLKNNNTKQYIELITLGGVVDDEAQIVYPNLDLQLTQNYLFFLAAIPSNLFAKTSTHVPRFCAYAHTQGALPLIDNKYKDFIQQQSIAPIDLLRRTQEITQFSAIQPNGSLYKLKKTPTTSIHKKESNSITLTNGLGETTPLFYAGTANENQELIISGSGFGSTAGMVQFANSDTGGIGYISSDYESDLVYWTDSEIRLKIPAKSGTGQLNVLHSNGQLVGNTNILIEWSLNPVFSTYRGFDNKTRQNLSFIDANENGGYTIEVNSTSGFLDDTLALAAFERALTKWQCHTTTNFQLDKTGTTQTFANDGRCVVQYTSDLPFGVLGIASSRYKSAGSSSCSKFNTLWYLKEFDIQFKPNAALENGFSWNFTTGYPGNKQYDFESIALHELGHAHGLGHVIDPENIMHYSVPSQEIKRNISAPQIAAMQQKLAFSAAQTCIGSYTPMESLEIDCPSNYTSARISLFLEGSYNEQLGEMTTHLVDEGLLPKEQPFEGAPYFYIGNESVYAFPQDVVDWVLLQIRAKNELSTILTQKALLVTKNGQLVDVNGNTTITLEALENDEYHIAIFHKSHLPIVSTLPHPFNSTAPLYDFTQSVTAARGTAQLKTKNNVSMMNSGDFDGNGIIDSRDFNLWKQHSSAINSYLSVDADGNGIINNQDFNLWKANRSKISVITPSN